MNAQVYGGHLVDATISATCEMVIRVVDGTVDREFNEDVRSFVNKKMNYRGGK